MRSEKFTEKWYFIPTQILYLMLSKSLLQWKNTICTNNGNSNNNILEIKNKRPGSEGGCTIRNVCILQHQAGHKSRFIPDLTYSLTHLLTYLVIKNRFYSGASIQGAVKRSASQITWKRTCGPTQGRDPTGVRLALRDSVTWQTWRDTTESTPAKNLSSELWVVGNRGTDIWYIWYTGGHRIHRIHRIHRRHRGTQGTQGDTGYTG